MPIGFARQFNSLSAPNKGIKAGARIGLASALLMLGAGSVHDATAQNETRTLSFHHTHSDEDLTVTFKRDGRYDEAALQKLNWFLRDFGYDAESLDRDEVDERRLVGLQGVAKVSHVVYDGVPLVRFDGFAPASRWEELSPANLDGSQVA